MRRVEQGCTRERERVRKAWKSERERENLGNRFRVSEAEDEGRKAMRGERGLVLSRGYGSMPSDNPALTNSEQEVHTENHDSCPQSAVSEPFLTVCVWVYVQSDRVISLCDPQRLSDVFGDRTVPCSAWCCHINHHKHVGNRVGLQLKYYLVQRWAS